MYKNLSACVGWETVFGKTFWAGVAEGGARGEFWCLIPPVQESRNWCLHVKEQNSTQESCCSQLH